MLVAALLPVTVLLFGVANLVSDQVAIWGTLWLAVVILGALGYLKVVSWSRKPWARVAGSSVASVLGAWC